MKYIARSNIKHNGTEYAKGDAIEIVDALEAQNLINDGVITTEGHTDVEDTQPQPTVNEVVREDGDVNGKVTVEEGKVETTQPQIGDADETEEEKLAREEQEKLDAEAKALAEKGETTEGHTVTEENLVAFPELVERGVKVGDVIAALPTKEDNPGDNL